MHSVLVLTWNKDCPLSCSERITTVSDCAFVLCPTFWAVYLVMALLYLLARNSVCVFVFFAEARFFFLLNVKNIVFFKFRVITCATANIVYCTKRESDPFHPSLSSRCCFSQLMGAHYWCCCVECQRSLITTVTISQRRLLFCCPLRLCCPRVRRHTTSIWDSHLRYL